MTKRFKFDLQALLRLKRQAKQLAELKQAEARMRLDAAQAATRAVEETLNAAFDEAAASRRDGTDVGLLIARQSTIEALQTRIAELKGIEREAQSAWERAADARRDLAVEVESLETLRETRLGEYRDEIARQSQVQLDENVMRRWGESARAARRNPS